MREPSCDRQTGYMDEAQGKPEAAGWRQIGGAMPHYAALDGWRGISILLVLAGHMLPFGPRGSDVNGAVAATGMVLFFNLSGFLITSTLLYRPSVPVFLIRRFCRILPLAWLYVLVMLPLAHAPLGAYPAHLLFYANLPPFWLVDHFTPHLWSLCVEMQFYMVAAVLCLALRRRGLLVLPVLCVAATANRIYFGQALSITTWFRADEILAGAALALLMHLPAGDRLRRLLARANPYVLFVLLGASAFESLQWLDYARPYLGAALVGSTLVRERGWLSRWLEGRFLRYMAKISYALYVLHEATMLGWLGGGNVVVRYAKRPFCIAMAIGAAHLSTNYYERYWIEWGKRLSRRIGSRQCQEPALVR